MIKIILADDHLLVRNGIKALIEDQKNIQIIATALDGQEAIDLVLKHQPDLLIVDIRMPLKDGIETVKNIREKDVATRTIILSMHDSEEYILNAIKAGAHGYLLKDTGKEEFIKAIHTVYDGGKYFCGDISAVLVDNLVEKIGKPDKTKVFCGLTKKEIQILELVLSGMTNIEISRKLNNSKRTVEAHRFNLMKKLNVKNIMELVAKAKEVGLS